MVLGAVGRVVAQDLVVTELEWVNGEDAPDVMPVATKRITPSLPVQLERLNQPAYGEARLLVQPDGQVGLVRFAQSSVWLVQETSLLKDFSPALRDGKGVWSSVRYFLVYNPPSAPVTGPNATPRLLGIVPPPVPEDIQKDVQVTVKAQVDETGRVTAATQVAGDPACAMAAERAVRRWTFAPARQDGRPVPGEVEVPVLFVPDSLAGSEGRYEAPRVLTQARPIYPFGLRRAGMAGEVVLSFLISVEGRVRSAEVVRSSHPGFDEAALEAVLQWTFRPGLKEGKPVETRMRVPIMFQIEGEEERSAYKITTNKKIQAGLPPEFRFDHAPQVKGAVLGVYPLAALRENKGGTMTVHLVIDEKGQVASTRIAKSPRDDLGRAAQAMIECFEFIPASREGKPTTALLRFDVRFSPVGVGDVPVSVSAERLLRQVKKSGFKFPSPGDLDAPIEAVSQRKPRFPRDVPDEVNSGRAVLEFIIDERGLTQLPVIVSSTHEAFGYAAAQAVSSWRFRPPTVNGRPVSIQVRLPMNFDRR